ncbi:MAG: PQQ-dependent sugar dehydrogenase [Chloroflexia bacterium]
MYSPARKLLALIPLVMLTGLGIAAWAVSPATHAGPSGPQDGTEPLPPGASIQTVLTGMVNPIALAFDPQGRLFYTEKTTGRVRLFENGSLQAAPVITFSVDSSGERGLLGITVDPAFTTTHYIYVYTTCAPAGGLCGATENQVVRFTENNGVGSNPIAIFHSPVDAATNHNGGNIHFGPDAKLYISIGDGGDTPQYSQDVTQKNGKMHRINSDGSIPADNPVFTVTGALPSLYARGLRNSFDFAFDTLVPGRIFASENGPSCDDEMNRIVGGYDYGWRQNYPCDDPNPSPQYNTILPLWFIPNGPCCEAPTGITVYGGNSVPQWTNGIFMATYNTGLMRHFYLDSSRTFVTATNVVQGVTVNTDIETGPDGALWYIEGGGYSTGTLKKIVGPGVPTPTPTTTPAGPTPTMFMPTPPPTVTPGGPTATPGPPPPTPVICTTQKFTDVPPSNPFYAPVQCLACRGLISGYDCGGPGEPCDGQNRPYFRWGANVTRGQLAKIVSNAADLVDTPTSRHFADVPPGTTFYLYIERLAERGYINGYDCGGPGEPCDSQNRPYFRVGANATRGQISKITAGTAQLTTDPGSQLFTDVPPGSPFYIWVNQLARLGSASGYTCGGAGEPCDSQNRPYFRPNTPATRGQTSKIVSNTFFPNCAALSSGRVNVTIQDFAFAPADITIPAGTTVRWDNTDLDYHTVTSDTPGLFDSGRIYQNGAYQRTFLTPGTYGYHCTPHPYMQGTITVTAP